LVPASVTKPLFAIKQNLAKESSSDDLEASEDEEERVAQYDHFIEEVDQFLSAPDKSSEEIDFKTEIEKYLDLIEEPANEEEIKEQQKSYGTLKISRKPQKLNLSSLGFETSLSGTDLDDEDKQQRPKDSKFIKDMQSKLAGDAAKDSPKDEIVIHTVGTSRLTKEFEKLGKTRDVMLLTAPKIVTKKTAEEMTAAAMAADSKPCSTTAWKWKKKDVNELYHHIKENYEVVPPAIQERQRILLETENCLEEKRAALEHDASFRSVEMLKKLEEERDQELEHFLNDVQQFLGKEKDNEVKNVLPSKGVKQKLKKETIETKPKVLELTGNVSSIRSFLENQSNELESEEDAQDRPKIGKIKTDFLQITKTQEKIISNKFVDPVVSSVDANRIKSRLVNQYFNKNEEPKTLFSAPKTKLQNFIPQEDKMAAASELGGLLRQKRSNSTTRKMSTDNGPVIKPIMKELPRPEVFEYKPPKAEPVKYKSPYAHIQSEEERKAAILSKYGVKPRPLRNSDSSSSLSSEEDQVEVKRKLNEQKEQLKEVYGLNDIKERRKERRSEKENAANSLYSLRNVLAQLRTTRSGHSNNGSRLNLAESSSSNDAIYKSDPDLSELKGTCSNTRAFFERLNGDNGEISGREGQMIERSATFSNVKSLFDVTDSPTEQSPRHSGLYKPVSNRSFSNVKNLFDGANSPTGQSPRHSGLYKPVSNRSFSNVKSVFEESEREGNLVRPSNVFSPANRSSNAVERSSSFHKFLGAFEAGRRLDDEDDDDSSDEETDDEQVSSRPKIASANAGSQKSLIQAELDEIRSNTRLQSVFRINRPTSSRPTLNSKFGNSSENLDLDEKTLQQVSTTRYFI
jgi:hypothetical protein